jgi:hypothetical protein
MICNKLNYLVVYSLMESHFSYIHCKSWQFLHNNNLLENIETLFGICTQKSSFVNLIGHIIVFLQLSTNNEESCDSQEH